MPALLVLACLVVFAGSAQALVFQAGDWRVDVRVDPDQPLVTLGEPAWLSFTVTNLSHEPLQILVGGDLQNDFGRPGSFTVRAVGKDGKWVPVPEANDRGSGGLVGPRDLPAGGSYVFRLFMPHWATFMEAGTYDIICRRTLQLLRPVTTREALLQQPINEVVVEVKTMLGVLPRDAARLKIVIDELGERMLEADGEKPGDEAVISLAWIEDPRVVPHFVRALKIRSYTMRFIAVQLFGRFGTDEAVAGLKAALALEGADFDGVTPEKSAELAARIRAAAVAALVRCRQPQARELIAAQRKDASERVRLGVVQALARVPRAQALPVLEEMSKDSSADVRAAVQRALASLQTAARK